MNFRYVFLVNLNLETLFSFSQRADQGITFRRLGQNWWHLIPLDISTLYNSDGFFRSVLLSNWIRVIFYIYICSFTSIICFLSNVTCPTHLSFVSVHLYPITSLLHPFSNRFYQFLLVYESSHDQNSSILTCLCG